MTRFVLVTLTVASLATTVTAQTFEVASVRQATAVVPGVPGAALETSPRHPPGRFVVRNWSLRALIAYAYGLEQSTEGPVFRLRGDRQAVFGVGFDIEARLPPGVESVSREEERVMLQALLHERFGLRVHSERQRARVYGLRRAGEALGHALKRIERDCTSWRRLREPPPLDPDTGQLCSDGARMVSFDRGFGQILRGSGDIAQLIGRVQGWVDRPVVDETGLVGNFAWEIQFTPVFVRVPAAPLPRVETALREQLGLDLVPTEAEVEVLVIDAVLSTPKPN